MDESDKNADDDDDNDDDDDERSDSEEDLVLNDLDESAESGDSEIDENEDQPILFTIQYNSLFIHVTLRSLQKLVKTCTCTISYIL